jgi:hypothetical protein
MSALKAIKYGLPLVVLVVLLTITASSCRRAAKADERHDTDVARIATLEERVRALEVDREAHAAAQQACERSIDAFVAEERRRDRERADEYARREETRHRQDLERQRALFESEARSADLLRQLEAIPEADRCEAAAADFAAWYRALDLDWRAPVTRGAP